MKNFLPILQKCPLFWGIAEEDLLRMLSCLGARVERFEKRHTILPEGSPADALGIVLSGSVQLVQIDYYGNRSLLSKVGPSHIFAEVFACAEVRALPLSVVAGEPCEVMMIDSAHVLHTCASSCAFHQALIFNLMKGIATQAVLFHQRIEITSKRTTREKLLAYLAVQAKAANSPRFEIPLDRQELADFLEVERSGLSAEIGKLKREGVLDSRKRLFELLLPL